MNRTIALLAPALIAFLPAGAAFAQNTDLEGCNTMLETAVGQGLRSEGIDTTNACHLTVSQLAQIKSLLTEDGMGSRARIELILDQAGK